MSDKIDQGVPVNARERFLPPTKRTEPAIDWLVTKIVGKKILAQDPRLIKLIIKWKANKPMDSKTPDNYLDNPEFIKELKKALGEGL